MNQSSNGVDTLAKLGLTRINARVYLAILNLEQPTAKTISQTLQIAKAEVYRASTELQSLGLIKKIISNPTIYSATPLADTINILLKVSDEKQKANCRQAQLLLKNYTYESRKSQEEVQYILRRGPEIERSELNKYLSGLQMSSDLISHWAGIIRIIDFHFEAYKRALKRGVKFRYITSLPNGQKMPEKIFRLTQIGSLEIRHTAYVPSGGLDLLDGKQLHFVSVPNGVFENMEVLRSNNPAMIEFAKDYFELKWRLSTVPNWHDNE